MALTQQALDGIRAASEKSLFYFMRTILGYKWLTASLHREMCEFMQNPTEHSKLMLVPRDFAKTTIMKGRILHGFIQPETDNIYFPGVAGTNVRVIIAGEIAGNASRHLKNIEDVIETNQLLNTLWPHVKPGRTWNEHEMILERTAGYSEPSCEALGTDTAIASRHVDEIYEDDIFTFNAAMSPTIAQRIRDWHAALEPILDTTENSHARQTLTGTPWSQMDIYKKILDDNELAKTEGFGELFAVYQRSCIENQQSIWPERFPLSRLKRIEFGLRGTGLWALNYMCQYGGGELSELKEGWLRRFELTDELVTY